MNIDGDGYEVDYDEDEGLVRMTGSMRLSTRDYIPIKDLLVGVASEADDAVVLDLRRLEFMNSSGINTLYKFAMALRERDDLAVKVLGDKAIAWQAKSLANFRRFAPSSELEWA